MTITKNSIDIQEELYENSLLFLINSIPIITKEKKQGISKEEAILSSVSIQISLELAIKFYLANNYGIKAILLNKYKDDSDELIYEKFISNDLKTKEFDTLKNFIKSIRTSPLNTSEINIIEKFQKYRNKLVHISYNFKENELDSIKADYIYLIVHVISKLLAEKYDYSPSELFREYLSNIQFEQLVSFPLYVENMQKMASNYGQALYCPICNNRTLSSNRLHCFSCCEYFDNPAYGFVSCAYCSIDLRTVIYDSANIQANQNMMRGLCLNCEEDTYVYKCLKCKESYNMEDLLLTQICNDNECIYFEE